MGREHLRHMGIGGKKVKGKVVPVLFLNRPPRHEGVLGSGGIASLIL
jgi:hypothetical protein